MKLGVDQTSKLVNYAYLNVPSPDDELPDTGEVAHVAGGDEGGPALAVHVVDVGPGLQQVLHTVQVTGPRGCSQCCPLLSVKQVHLRGNNHWKQVVKPYKSRIDQWKSVLVLGGHENEHFTNYFTNWKNLALSISPWKLHGFPFCKKSPKIPQFASLIRHSTHCKNVCNLLIKHKA